MDCTLMNRSIFSTPPRSLLACRPVSACVRMRILLIAAVLVFAASTCVTAQSPQWIWSSEHPVGAVPNTSVFFRKSLRLPSVEQASIAIIADDRYELFVNGRLVGRGESVKALDRFELTGNLVAGRNVIAVRVDNSAGATAALSCNLMVKPRGEGWRTIPSDATWRSSLEGPVQWQGTYFNDSKWLASAELGEYGQTEPWDRNSANPTASDSQTENLATSTERFRIQPGFAVELVLDEELTGSLVAMAFNEFGHIIAAKEGGPLLLIYDSDKDEIPDKVREYCDLVENIQGILPLNGDVFVTGDGPEGHGLYRLVDENRDGTLEDSSQLIAFQGQSGEHSAHQITLGPDGHLYIMLGNHTDLVDPAVETSPYRVWYDDELQTPKFEDPGGHARGIKAPGGTVVRYNLATKRVERFCGGIRNAYDLAIHPNGGIFTHDSDMESDQGMTWYRPTAVYELASGGEFGWRSGWSKWPEYFVDRLPSVLDTSRGSPTGICVYDHYQFPARYQQAIFSADWSEGRILALTMTREGATYRTRAETFLTGEPLNVTDLEVGPDGGIYFCTGGRGTSGGIYRIRWTGPIPDSINDLGDGIAAAIRQPQLNSAWGRQQVALLKRDIGQEWNDAVVGVAYSPDNPSRYRVRALDLMQLLGPKPSADLLIELSRSPSEDVRIKTTTMLGQVWADTSRQQDSSDEAQATSEEDIDPNQLAMENHSKIQRRLGELLDDPDPMVRRKACESLVQIGGVVQPDAILPLLSDQDAFLATAARRLLESEAMSTSLTDSDWNSLLNNRNSRIVVQSALAYVTSQPSRQNSIQVIDRIHRRMQDFVSDRDFGDLLRVAEVAILRGGLEPNDIPAFREQIAREFPTGESRINRELIRLAVHLQCPEVASTAIAYLNGPSPLADRVFTAMHLSFLRYEWTPAQRHEIIKFLEQANTTNLGSSVPLYIMQTTNRFAEGMSFDEAKIFVSDGEQWPNAALAGLYKFPSNLSDQEIRLLTQLDRKIDQSGAEADAFKRLKTGITAVLAQCGQPEAMEYLREAWRRSPDRRAMIALGLSQSPNEENWNYCIQSLSSLEPDVAPDVLAAIYAVDLAPQDPEVLRQLILLGKRMLLARQPIQKVDELLQLWTQAGLDVESDTRNASDERIMNQWTDWFATNYPNQLPAQLPEISDEDRWTYDEIEQFLIGDDRGDPSRENGLLAFNKAQCNSCHRFDGRGPSIGPDLTNSHRRYSRQEFLESVLFPSHVISNQYQTSRILTVDGQSYNGMALKNANGTITLRDSSLNETVIPEEDIDELSPSQISLMPRGLLNELSLDEIRDLMCYVGYLAETEEVADETTLPPVIRR